MFFLLRYLLSLSAFLISKEDDNVLGGMFCNVYNYVEGKGKKGERKCVELMFVFECSSNKIMSFCF